MNKEADEEDEIEEQFLSPISRDQRSDSPVPEVPQEETESEHKSVFGTSAISSSKVPEESSPAEIPDPEMKSETETPAPVDEEKAVEGDSGLAKEEDGKAAETKDVEE